MLAEQFWPLAAAFALFCWVLVVGYARPTVLVALVMGLFTGEAIFGAAPRIDVAGIAVYGRDAVFLAMLAVGVARLGTRQTRPRRSGLAGWAWWSLLVLVSLSFVRGVHLYGANLAGNDFRPAFYLLAGVVGIALAPSKWPGLRDMVDVWIGVALLLVAVGFARIMGLTVGLPVDQQAFLNGRPLYAWPTLVIAQAALLSFFAVALKSRWASVPGLPYLFMIGVLLFRHRTVWAALGISLVAMWTFLRPKRADVDSHGSRQWAGVVVGGAVLVGILLTGKGGSLERDLTTATATATSQGSTFLWRIEGWKALLDAQGANPWNLVLGIPYGAGYHREVFDAEVEYSPHSWYVQTVSRVGLLGCGFMVFALLKLMRRGRSAGLFPRALGALLVLSIMVYGIAYYPPELDGILLGLVVLSARHVLTKDGEENDPETTAASRPSRLSGLVPVPG